MDMYSVFQIAQLVIRLIIYTFIGKGLLAILAGANYRENFIWRFFDTLTRPFWKLTRLIAPKFIHDATISYLTVFLLIALNVGMYMFFFSQGWITPPREDSAG